MIIYIAFCDAAPEHEIACKTLREARKVHDASTSTKIKKVDTGPLKGRDLAVALFNREGYAATTVDIP